MPSLREDITKTFRRLGRRDRTIQAARAETEPATDTREGKDFGAYRILRRLGFGGMGQVYLCLDTRLGRHVALKFLDDRLLSDPTMLDRLYQEARTTSSLNHPNILTIHEISEVGGEHFIASEFVEGITVGDAIDRKLITPKMAVEIATQVASALVAAHSAGVIHRDLKATNIMIRPDGLVKVIDFGLAKRSEERLAAAAAAGERHSPLSTPGGIAGTVEYMSPEQARGDTVDQRSDLWSLGVLLYEMLAGKFPFMGSTEGHVLVAIMEKPVAPIERRCSPPRRHADSGACAHERSQQALPIRRRNASRSAKPGDFETANQFCEALRSAGRIKAGWHHRYERRSVCGASLGLRHLVVCIQRKREGAGARVV
jgi:serine/threonine protein kinase